MSKMLRTDDDRHRHVILIVFVACFTEVGELFCYNLMMNSIIDVVT